MIFFPLMSVYDVTLSRNSENIIIPVLKYTVCMSAFRKTDWNCTHIHTHIHSVIQPLFLAFTASPLNVTVGWNKQLISLPPYVNASCWVFLRRQKHTKTTSPPSVIQKPRNKKSLLVSGNYKQPTHTNLSASLSFRINKTVKEQITAGNSSVRKHRRTQWQHRDTAVCTGQHEPEDNFCYFQKLNRWNN